MKSVTTVLVTGAGGFIGSHLIPALYRAGYAVRCGGRDVATLQARFPACQAVECDFATTPSRDGLDAMVLGASVVINAVGIIQEHGTSTFEAVHRDGPGALFQAAERAGVQRVIQLSALGADAEAQTRYHCTKRAADDLLRSLSLDWVILQPSLVYGPGGRSQGFFAALAALPIMPLIGHGDQRIQPVHVDDLVEGIVRLVPAEAARRVTLSVVGPAPVTFRQFLETVRCWLGLAVGPALSVPPGLMRLVARVGDVIRCEFVTTDALAMLSRGNTADTTPFTTATGVRSRSLSTGLPAYGANRPEVVTASLHFLRPLLLVSLAAVWIGSGVVSLVAFPQATSEGWLLQAGIPAAWAGPALMAVSGLDVVLGLAMLVRWRLALVIATQLVLIVGFSVLLTVRMPEWWAHPFGPLLKNLPLFVATLILWALERR